MATIVILGVRFNLDRLEEREIHDALYSLPQGQRVSTVKKALRSYLLKDHAEKETIENGKKTTSKRISPPVKMETPGKGNLPEQVQTPPGAEMELPDQTGPQETNNQEIIDSLKSMIR